MKKKLLPMALLLTAMLLVVLYISISTDLAAFDAEKTDNSAIDSIVITEICSKNETILADNDGKHRDYVELFNAGAPVDLSGFVLYDGKVKSPQLDGVILETGEYRVFFISRSSTGFALSASGGDTIQLLDTAGKIVAQTNTAALEDDEVMLLRDGIYINSFEASPGFSNDDNGRSSFLKGTPAASPALVISEVLITNVSAIPAVRSFLLEQQRSMAKRQSVIMDGRDIGTVVLPDAEVKIFLTATPEARAERRYKELKNCNYRSLVNEYYKEKK